MVRVQGSVPPLHLGTSGTQVLFQTHSVSARSVPPAKRVLGPQEYEAEVPSSWPPDQLRLLKGKSGVAGGSEVQLTPGPGAGGPANW